MAFSVNTNGGALQALSNLNKTSSSLQTTQNRINTGQKVSSAKDDAATFAIASGLRADLAGLNSVQGSLDRASSTLDVAIAAGEAVTDLLKEMGELAVSAADEGVTTDSRAKYHDEFDQIRNQIDSIVSEAEFNGTNAVKATPDNIITITNADASGKISIAGANLSTTGLGLNASTISTQGGAATAVGAIDAARDTVLSALSDFGAGSKRLELQSEFTSKLSDSIEVGIGNLVDADLAKESANLQALQAKQQLGLQALGIANSAPSAVLGLF